MQKRWIRRAAVATLLILGVVGAIFLRPAGELVDRGCGSNPSGPAALVAVDADSGDLLWSSRAGHAFGVGGGPGVVAVGGTDGILRGFDGSAGEIVWCLERPAESESGTRFTAAGPIIATLSRHGDVVAIEPSTGRERWRGALGHRWRGRDVAHHRYRPD